MSLSTGRTRLAGSLKQLMLRWEKAKEQWDDPVSAEFEKTVLASLEPKVRAAVSAMEHMGELLGRVRRDCE